MNMTKGYICYCKDENLRIKSTSGGVFGIIAKKVLAENGVIYGVEYDEMYQAVYGRAENWDSIAPFHGSKYIQSNSFLIFKDVKRDILIGKKVLFSGTPCQVAALQQYLSVKEREKVIFLDFICKGIPSPKIWKMYLDEISKGRKIKSICFKDKRSGWVNFTFVIKFEDGSEYVEDGRSNLFMKGFFGGLTVRPSCFECPFRGIERTADFSIGDAWGLEKEYPEMYDDKGTSVLFVHTKRGQTLFHEIEHSFYWKAFDVQLLRHRIEKKWNSDNRREKFYHISEKKGVVCAFKIFTKQSCFSKTKSIIKRICHI